MPEAEKGKSQTFDIVRNVAYNERTGTLMFVLGTLVCNADGTHDIVPRGQYDVPLAGGTRLPTPDVVGD